MPDKVLDIPKDGTAEKMPPSATRAGDQPRWSSILIAGAFLGAAVLFVVGNWIVMPFLTRGTVVRVPDLFGLDVAVAKRALLDSGLVFVNDSTDYLWDDEVPANHVIMQNPPSYALVKRGRRVRVTISRGPQMFPVPDVRNISPLEAKLRLQQQRFDVGTVRYVLRTNEDRSEPFVSEQTPAPGTMAPRGAKVSISVSVIPEMPDLRGRSLEEARHIVEILGLQIGSVTSEQSDTLLPQSVISQSIPPGAHIQVGDRVDLILSRL